MWPCLAPGGSPNPPPAWRLCDTEVTLNLHGTFKEHKQARWTTGLQSQSWSLSVGTASLLGWDKIYILASLRFALCVIQSAGWQYTTRRFLVYQAAWYPSPTVLDPPLSTVRCVWHPNTDHPHSHPSPWQARATFLFQQTYILCWLPLNGIIPCAAFLSNIFYFTHTRTR